MAQSCCQLIRFEMSNSDIVLVNWVTSFSDLVLAFHTGRHVAVGDIEDGNAPVAIAIKLYIKVAKSNLGYFNGEIFRKDKTVEKAIPIVMAMKGRL